MPGVNLISHPQLSTPFPPIRDIYVSKATGLKVPLDVQANLKYREHVLRSAEHDMMLQQELLLACKLDGLYWVNTFGFTYWQFETDPETGKQRPARQTHQPMITWDCQNVAWNAFCDAFVGGEDVGVRKSRDMGASWLCMFFLHHMWLFRPDTQIREMSRVEDYVDGPTSKSLFWKHDYINSWLPKWMRPPGVLERGTKNRTKLRIHNELNNSTIAGESTTKYSMSGDRCSILLLDEFSKVENGEEIRTATADVTPCRIVNSTPTGAGSEYSRWMNSGQIKVVELMFWEHPEKGVGRFVIQDGTTKKYTISSRWLEHQKKRRTAKEIAQECYAEDLEAGDTFFDNAEVDRHIARFGRTEPHRFNVNMRGRVPDEDIPDILKRRDTRYVNIVPASNGKLRVWAELIDMRPDQTKTYVFGIDTSTGRGASESVVSIRCKQTGEKIARWSCRNTTPFEFAKVIVALALWCGGCLPQSLPFLTWEKNGPGLDLGKRIVKIFKYPYFYTNKVEGVVGERRSERYGWHSSREGKQLLLRAYERELLTAAFINHDTRGLEQAKFYIYYPSGGVGPASLKEKSLAEMLLHGDIVMADALTVDMSSLPEPKPVSPVAPTNSWGGRFEKWKRGMKKKTNWRKRFDFR